MISRLQPKHWTLIAGYMTSVALVVGGQDHWRGILNPPIVAGLITLTATFIGALFAGAPPNPNLNAIVNPARRANDPTPPTSLGSVTDATRRTL